MTSRSAVTVSEEQMASLHSGVEICFQTFGDPSDPPILLVMGLSGPMGWWDAGFCRDLAAGGHFVIRFDNRDVGRSTRFREHKVTRLDVVRAFLGLGKGPYTLDDLADDAFGVLDHLGLEQAHVVGVSMGGMIVQTMAIARPERVLSMTSIMSTTGRRTVGFQSPKVIPGLLESIGDTREEYIAASLRTATRIASPEYPTTEEVSRARAEETWDRGPAGSGVLRQMLAILTQPDRTKALGRLEMPVTVVHGLADPLVHRSGGRATARAIPGARHLEIPGMAHDLPQQLHATFIEAITDCVARGEARR
ncbi:MAG: alpha/beta hydrolase [Aeromicrobium erythreum]